MLEDIARRVLYALLDKPIAVPGEMVNRLNKRYTDKYGQ
jgi:hypothetical protein